ncbi:MAG: 1,4-alpha-glucan branching protein GlgB [Lachnospiraceae bacterium]|nr:1,4-alpha-glucan branching protein GlgB [Lachnospiraceae bacterium]
MNERVYRLMNWSEIESIIYSEADNPHRLLGPHAEGGETLVQAFFPDAQAVKLVLADASEYDMDRADEAGYFAVLVPAAVIGAYSYRITYPDGTVIWAEDPYRFEPVITQEDTAKFGAGIHYEAYRILGAHLMSIDGVDGVHFAVWAPNAMRVSVVGDFNNWDGRIHQMRRLWDSGIFEIFIPGVTEGSNYKFELKAKGGLTYLKADPYAFGSQMRPDTASVVRSIDGFSWEDENWIAEREKKNFEEEPISVYEMYLGSFAKPDDGRIYYNYRELAPKVISYIKEMGYTHVELMPIMEHPFDGSWGYQVIGYYSPTSRYGTPEDFMYFVNELHKAKIGVILDWVPAHFPRDAHGLSNFDGTCLYEHKDPRQGAHPHWGTLIYNYGRPQVRNYLIANALYWIEQFHADGIRMDAVASMLYLDYGKNDGEWVANMYGGNENLEAVEFLKHVNSMIAKRGKGAISIAEESTAWPKITGDLNDEGLGFTLKWNMGWMNDFLNYIRNDPYFRSYHHNEITFSMVYAYSEHFMLVLSHDEVVHGKASILGKMPGEDGDKFANLKASYGYMMTHPGKKLLFMGQDIAEYDEWNENRSVEWELLDADKHKGVQKFVKKLNELYCTKPAMYLKDTSWDGFEWINCINSSDCNLSYIRKGEKEEDTLLVCVNFANVDRESYQVGVPFAGKYEEILNSDAKVFNGEGRVNTAVIEAAEAECDGREYSIKIRQAPLSVSVFSYIPYTEEEKLAVQKAKEGEAKKKAEAEAVKKPKKKGGTKKSLKDKLSEKVEKADEAIAAGTEVEKPVRVTRAKKKASEEATAEEQPAEENTKKQLADEQKSAENIAAAQENAPAKQKAAKTTAAKKGKKKE